MVSPEVKQFVSRVEKGVKDGVEWNYEVLIPSGETQRSEVKA